MKNEQPPYYPPYVPEEEMAEESINWIAIAKTLLNGKKTIIIAVIIGLVIGVFVAIVSTKQYTVSTVIVPQMANKSSTSGLSSLAALAGIDLGTSMSTGEISPLIYPQIVSSTPFQLELMNAKYTFTDVATPVSLYDYYTKYKKPTVIGTVKKYTLGLPGLLISALKKKKTVPVYDKNTSQKLLVLSKEQSLIADFLNQIITTEVDAKQGYLTLTVAIDQPLLTAQIAQKAQEILQREIIRFKVQKAQADLEFIQERYNELKAKAEGYQVGIAKKTDQYKNLVSTVPQVQTTRLQTQYGIANTVFMEIAKQLEQAKIQVKRDTPTFTIIQPVVIPIEPSGTSRVMIIMAFIVLSSVMGVGIVFGKGLIKGLKEKWKDENYI